MPNKIFINPNLTNQLIFTDATTPATHLIDLNALANDGANVSARADLGSAARPHRYRWRAVMRHQGTSSVIGNSIDLYLATSDGTLADGEVAATKGALGDNNKLRNLWYIGSVIVTTVSANTDMIASGFIPEVNARYISLVVHNQSGATLQNTNNVSQVIITPVPLEVQS